jgi:hypothetical protein
MMGAAPLLLVVPASRSSRLDDDAEDTSYVFGNTPAAERFHTSYYRNGSCCCLHFTAAKVIAYIIPPYTSALSPGDAGPQP